MNGADSDSIKSTIKGIIDVLFNENVKFTKKTET